jgi:CBS-domain-containing membrane protein
MKVHEWLKQYPKLGVTVAKHWALDEILTALLNTNDTREIFVIDEQKRVIGHITYQKVAQLVLAEHTASHTRSQIMERVTCGYAIDLMDAHFDYASPDEELGDILQRHLDHVFEEMPVLNEHKQLLGVVCLRDILKSYL